MEIEMIQSQCQSWIPLVNGILLHSSVNPKREAKQFIDQVWDRVSGVKNVVIFGLGGGYHINELLNRGKENILVIESSTQLAEAVLLKNPDLTSRVKVLSGVGPEEIHQHPEILKVLASSYGVIYHAPSVQLNKEYYSSVSDALSQRTLRRLRELTKENKSLNHFLEAIDLSEHQLVTLPMMEQAMKRNGSPLDREGLIWMTLRELVV